MRPLSFGFIPAHAGNGRQPPGSRGCNAVHPRACGERVRRKVPAAPRIRFIPAHAGNGRDTLRYGRDLAVHPRACGERVDMQAGEFGKDGSSPRRRGTGCDEGGGIDYHRFIPAQAGNGSAWPARSPVSAVHPRAGGERGDFWAYIQDIVGSSPRRRGTAMRRGSGVRGAAVHPRAGGERGFGTVTYVGMSGSSPRRRGTAR